MYIWIHAVLVSYLLFAFSSALAAGEGRVDINGFFTTSFTQTNNDIDTSYLNGLASDELSLDTYENRIGIQLASRLTDDAKFTAQLISRGGNYNYDLNIDWAYLDYGVGKNFNTHIGKYKIPLFIVSDYAEVGFAYPWARPPQEVYYINPLISQAGLKLFYNIPLNGANILFQLFYGEGSHDVFVPARSLDIANSTMAKDQRITLKTRSAGGASISIKTRHVSFRLGYFDTKVDAPDMGIENASGDFSSAGFTIDWRDIILFSEYANRDTDTDKIRAFPDQQAWYLTLGYRLADFLPYATYAEIDEGDDTSALSITQSSVALGLRYEVNKTSAIKFEALQATPDEGNHGLFNEPVDKGMMYSITVDAIF